MIQQQKAHIVTFSCGSDIHVYFPNSSVSPASPYRTHETIKAARAQLQAEGRTKIEIIEYYGSSRNRIQ